MIFPSVVLGRHVPEILTLDETSSLLVSSDTLTSTHWFGNMPRLPSRSLLETGWKLATLLQIGKSAFLWPEFKGVDSPS